MGDDFVIMRFFCSGFVIPRTVRLVPTEDFRNKEMGLYGIEGTHRITRLILRSRPTVQANFRIAGLRKC